MNKVYLTDCLPFMSSLPDNYYDFVIADPWYGIGMTKNDTTGFMKKRFRNQAKGTDQAPPKEHFVEMRRISKHQIIWGGNYFLDYLGNCRAPIIWDKCNGKNYFADGEMAWTSFKTGTMRIYRHKWSGCFRDSERGETLIHPCQKPVALYRWLLQRFLQPGMTVFSPYVGSGSDRIACYALGIDFEGCEIDPDYWQAQEERYQQYTKQGEMFSPADMQRMVYGEC